MPEQITDDHLVLLARMVLKLIEEDRDRVSAETMLDNIIQSAKWIGLVDKVAPVGLLDLEVGHV